MKIEHSGSGLRLGFVLISVLMAWALHGGSVFAATPFTPGDIAVLQLTTNSNNTTGTIIELAPSGANQTPTLIIPILATGPNPLRFSDSGTSSFLSTTNDGTLLVISGYNTPDFMDGNLATSPAPLNVRAAATLDINTNFLIQTTYTGISANQTRSATSLDDANFYFTDKGGLYTNGASASSIGNVNILNARAFGGAVYISSTAASAGVSTVSGPTATTLSGLPGLAADSKIQDFYLVQSGQNGSTYDVLYTLDQGGTNATINKFSLVNNSWVPNGTPYTLLGNATSMIAANNGTGGANLYVVTTAQIVNNSVLQLTDSAGFNTAINIPAAGSTVAVSSATASPAFIGTMTTASTTGMTAGQLVVISGMAPAGYNGCWTVTQVVSSTQFTVQLASFPVSSTHAGTYQLLPGTNLYSATGAGTTTLKGIAFAPIAATAPTVTSPTKTGVGSTTATLGGDITATGGQSITDYGIVYSLTSANADPRSGTGVTKVSGTLPAPISVPYTVSISSLQVLSGYSFAAYATNGVGTSYSSVGTFTTGNPTVDTPTATAITTTSATLGGTVETNGGATITATGVAYALTSTNSNPQIGGAGVTVASGSVIQSGAFTVPVTGLTISSSYSFTAFATNSSGTAYSNPATFNTIGKPVVTLPTFVAVTVNSATLGASVNANGNPITSLGVVYALTSANSNPQIGGTGVTVVSGSVLQSGAFTVPVSGLSAASSYTFEAFATNGIGTTYSLATNFTTAAPGVIASWTFPAPVAPNDNSPTPTYGAGTLTTLGMTNSYNGGNLAADDVISTSGTANINFTENTWRVRGSPNNGWATHAAGAPQFSQGFEADTSTLTYSNIVFSFDWYSTTQGIRDLQVQYNTGSGWVNYQGPSPTGTFVATSNDYYNSVLSPVNPTIYIDLSGVPAANNNANLGIRLVSAFDSTGHVSGDYASSQLDSFGNTQIYNNSSGNWRFGNITFAAGTLTSTTLAASPASSQKVGQNVTLTATVTPASGTQFPSGTVKFYDGATLLGSQSVAQVGITSNGNAAITINTLLPGTHSAITAQFIPSLGNGFIASGSSMNLVVGAPTNNPISYTIIGPAATGVDVSPVVSQPFTGVVATFSEGVDINPSDFTATINWGDGSPTVPGVVAFSSNIAETNIFGNTVNVIVFTVTGTHTYATAGAYSISVAVTDVGNNTSTVGANALVAYPPLFVSGVAPISTNVGTTSLINQTVATFTDPGLVANLGVLGLSDPTTQFSASINWGDTTTSTGSISYNSNTKVFSVIGSHTYAVTGPYTITVTVTPLTIAVSRIDSSDPNKLNQVGDENGNGLTDAASAAFIDHFAIGAAGQPAPLYTFSLPTVSTTSGNEALTYSSYSKTEGAMALSTNGQYLVLGGYNLTVNLFGPQSTFSQASVINRVIARINGSGLIDTTTALTDAYNGDNFRGVASTDGTQFWTCGHAGTDTTSDFVRFAAYGASTSTKLTLASAPDDINTVAIFSGQLYQGVRKVATGAPAAIYQIGSGLPTTGGQNQSVFIQVPQSNLLDVADSGAPYGPFGFYMTALNNGNPTVNGVNVAYIADAEMGILRYDHLSTGWQFSYYINSTGSFLNSVYTVDASGNATPTGGFNSTFPIPASNPNTDSTKAGGVRALTGRVVNGQVQLFATTGFGTGIEPNPGNSLIQLTDTGANSAFTTLAKNSNTASVYTGIAFTPFQTVTTSLTIPAFPAPVAFNGGITVTGTTAKAGTLLGSDPNSASLTFAIVANGTKGTAVITNAATGAFTYTATANIVATDSFTFKVTDANGVSNIATVTVAIVSTAVGAPPTASNSVITVTGTAAGTGTLVANAPDGLPLTFALVANGTKGTAAITNAATGAFSYTATTSAAASTTDTFTFTATDADGKSNVATVTVTILPSATPPVGAATMTTTGTVTAGSSVSFDATGTSPNAVFYVWDFGDGTLGFGPTPSHTYTTAGTYTVTMTPYNAQGIAGTPATTTVVIAAVIPPALPTTSFTGKFGKNGNTSFKLALTLPTGTSVGSALTVTIGTFTGSINKIASNGKSGHGTGGSVKISGANLTFTLKSSASALFGSPVPTTGTKSVNITVNGVLYQHTTTFTTSHNTTSFN